MMALANERWARDAYRTYLDCLMQGKVPTEGVHVIGTLPVPPEVDAIPLARRHLLPASVVARWAYRQIELHEPLTEIAASEQSDGPSGRAKAREDRYWQTRASGSEDERAYEQSRRRALGAVAPPDGDAPTTESIRKAIARYAHIWDLARREWDDA